MKEAGERGSFGSKGGEAGGDGRRKNIEVRETHPARSQMQQADEDEDEDEDAAEDGESALKIIGNKGTDPEPESAATGMLNAQPNSEARAAGSKEHRQGHPKKLKMTRRTTTRMR
jgi:hypothetical protein